MPSRYYPFGVDSLGTFAGKAEAFLASYEKELEFRIRQGGRGLFFLSQERTRVGVANVYIGHGDRGYLPRPVVALYEPSCMLSRSGSDKGLENVYVCFRGATHLAINIGNDMCGESLAHMLCLFRLFPH